MSVTETARPCERLCPKCEQWKHHSRFRSKQRKTRHGSMTEFRRLCKDCEQIERNERLNVDRPKAIIERRTADHARTLGVPKAFLWVNMGWSTLVPDFRAALSPEGRCQSCGHRFVNERDIQIEHREPPRPHGQDWSREHARNLAFFCQSCNNTKGDKPYAIWLDEQEAARLSNETHRASQDIAELAAAASVQLTIDGELA